MNLREKAGGDENLFSVERKLKRLQKRRQKQNEKAYEREKNKRDVFNFLNKTLSVESVSNNENVTKNEHRQNIKQETSRNLNVANLQIDENIKKCETDIVKLKQSLSRHNDVNSTAHKSLKSKLVGKQKELQMLKHKSMNIKNEQKFRQDKKKMTVF